MSGRTMTRDQALAWNSKWSFTDREVLEASFDRLDAQTFYMPPSLGYIGCMDSGGTRVMFIHAGYVTFKRGLAPEVRPEGWERSIPLSTFSPHASPNYEPEFEEEFCPEHNLSLPATGKCDFCDE